MGKGTYPLSPARFPSQGDTFPNKQTNIFDNNIFISQSKQVYNTSLLSVYFVDMYMMEVVQMRIDF